MKSVKILLEEFDSCLKKYNLLNYQKLQQPFSEGDIENSCRKIGVKDLDFKEFFRWKNGFDPKMDILANCQIFNFGSYMLSSETIISRQEFNKTQNLWRRSFVPIIEDRTGQTLLFNNSTGADYGKLHLYSASSLSVTKPISYYDSISAMIETTIQSYETGALIYDENEDWLNRDVDKYFEIAKKINSASKYWVDVN